MLLEWIEVELDRYTIRTGNLLVFQIHGQCCVSSTMGNLHQHLQFTRFNLDQQHAVLEAVGIKDICEVCGYDATNTEIV